ncbi:MAG TPA: hypothetical protein VK783_10940 [Bacteroidia bacterium]|nr:hypothetical protein [Bacteroidia bacterium]
MEETNTNELPEELTEQEKKEITWEENNEKIIEALRYLQRKQIKATVSNIAIASQLSRKTVYKHINEKGVDIKFATKAKVNKLMLEELMYNLCRSGCYGDVKAAKLYLEALGIIKRGGWGNTNTMNTNLVTNTNAVMVNGLAFTNEMVQNLSAENLLQLENFVRAAAQSEPKDGLQNDKNILNITSENQDVDG